MAADFEMDALDAAILRILQTDNKMPQRQIGEAVNLSAPAVQRRIARMEASGVIRQNVAVVEPDAVRQNITVVVSVTATGAGSTVIDRLRALFLAAPEVQQCYRVTGDLAFILIMVVPSMSEYETRTRRLLADNPDVHSYTSMVVLDRVKAGLAVYF